GSFLLGAIIRFAMDTPAISPEVRALLTIGLCGGYTTFSTFSFETAAMLEDGEWSRAALYIAASVGLSLLATFLGFIAARGALSLRGG
ncbi:MAG: CrcB family protein, partial [Gemmatimonadales bacterium]